MIFLAILIFSADPSRSQEESSDQSPAAADTLSVGSQALTQMEVETLTPAPARALSCDAETADLIAQLDLASTRIARLETELTEAGTLTDKLSGQVRTAQVIIRDIETQRADLEAQMGGSEGGQCPATGAAVQCAASASQVDTLRAQVAACTEGADPDAALQTRIDELSAQVASIKDERDALQLRVDAARGEIGGSVADGETSVASETVTALTLQRDRALEDADAAQLALGDAVAERDAVRDQLAETEARMVEVRTAAVIAIGASSGALTVCENSPVAGGVVLSDETAARSFKAGLGVMGDDMEILVSPVPPSGIACVLQPIAGLLAPASQSENAFVADYGTVVRVVDFLPRSVDCDTLLETQAVQDLMANAEGFGSAKRALWVQDAGAPALCGSRNGQVGLLRVEPRNQSAVFFLTAQTF
jgi:phage shock protein A